MRLQMPNVRINRKAFARVGLIREDCSNSFVLNRVERIGDILSGTEFENPAMRGESVDQKQCVERAPPDLTK